MDLKIYETYFVERHENTFKLQDLLTDKNIEGIENAMVENDYSEEASVILDQRSNCIFFYSTSLLNWG